MRRLYTVMMATLLLTACHSKQKNPDSPIATDTVQDTTTYVHPISSDGEHEWQVGTDHQPQTTDGHTIHRDTAETTNLRLFARKQKTIYSPALMVGEWLRGSEHEQYLSDGTGRHWDTGDDIQRDEAKSFTWTLDSNLLTFKYNIALGGLMVRQYVVTFVDDETLVYSDAYGDSYMWDKLPATR